ncbi:MAG: hypothetical protein KDD35_03065, partial [Bdellovibrionales bacterium]|nr:hypothetical protein [Bdellovibrionales bacterium]
MLTELKKKIVGDVAQLINLPEKEILSHFEVPKELDHGDLSFPVFFLAKHLKKAPPLIAQDIARQMEARQNPLIEKVVALSG